MSLGCVNWSKASHFSTVPHSIAGNTHFSEKNSLDHQYASKVHGTSNFLSGSKQNDSDGLQKAHTDSLKKSVYLDSQIASSNLNGNYSKEEKSSKKRTLICCNGKMIEISPVLASNSSKTATNGMSKETCSVKSNIQHGKTATNDTSKEASSVKSNVQHGKTATNGTSKEACSVKSNIQHGKTATNGTPKEACSVKSNIQHDSCTTESKSLRKISNGALSLSSSGSKKVPTINVASVAASNPSNYASSEISSVNSTANVDDSPSEKDKVLVEKCGVIDVHADADSSKTSDEGAKVIVQTLPKASSIADQLEKGVDEISYLDSCFYVPDMVERLFQKKRGDFSVQNDESTRCSANGKEEKPSDVYQKRSLTSKALTKRKMRRNHEMNFHIRPGRGIRLRDIAHIVNNIESAPPSLLRFLHKILFGSYGGSNNENSLLQTRQNILHFSGFPFSEDSEIFEVKRKCLSKVPYPMLQAICNTLLGITPSNRDESVEELLKFLQEPTNSPNREQQHRTGQKNFIETEEMKQQAMKGPYPIILLHKLSESYVKEQLEGSGNKPEDESFTELSDIEFEEENEETIVDVKTTQGYDLPNDRIQLKDFPEVVLRVKKARRRIINLLHVLLYGRPGSDEHNRLNILEFSGFSHYDARNYRRKKEFLIKLRTIDLDPMCYIFSLRNKSVSKMAKVIKFLHHLKASSLAATSRRKKKLLSKKNMLTRKQEEPLHEFKKEVTKTEVFSERKVNSYKEPIKKLKDFEKIRRNIECASPKELNELNDLLFLKPSNNLDIHQQILEFSSSSFRENSPEFHSRRTLLYYMSFEVIKKMAALLEITDWEEYSSPQGLATTLLRFLVDMKPSVEIRQKIKPRVRGLRKKPSLSHTHRPHLMRLQKDNSSWENNNINRNLTTSAIHNSTHVKEGYHEESCMQETSVIVRRISEHSYSFTDTRTNEPVTISDSNSDESLSLYDFVTHPSDKQLEVTIREMVYTNTWKTSMGDLINRVFHCYPKLNLTYRIDFIKAKALEVIHEIQNCAKPSENGV